ncbi:unnamed protein product [Rotaria sp. Silwood1]|nr:unnamed protein product [Rotaria sp. Silwood1]CAF4656132.1 unnamed protein product [Rotaria sp. Silwood1]CAF4674803.1 unnamed protein product [Rotaria sp. Silwood1]
MMTDQINIQVDEIIHQDGGQVAEAEYLYKETRGNGEERNYHLSVKRRDYERLAASIQKPTLPFDQFVKVLKPFMIGPHAADDIPEAFRLLDVDHSGTIDIGELAAFMPVIVPDANPYMLLHHIQKVDQNSDYKLNLAEFTALINRVVEAEYLYKERRWNGGEHNYRVSIKQQDYERLVATIQKPMSPFGQFDQALKPFMIALRAADDIFEASRLLDADRLGTNDIGQSTAFILLTVLSANSYMFLYHNSKR